MARAVIPGIYKITNTTNGLVYIGQSKDILKRFQQYYWSATSMGTYSDTVRTIIKAIRTDGIENFTFEILATGPKYEKLETRLIAEIKYIAKYKANDPAYGYNQTAGGDYNPENARKQSFHERLQRATPVFLYDIETQAVLLYWFGARAVADDFKCDKAITSHAMNRCDVFNGKYFIIPARYEDRHVLYEKKLTKLSEVHSNPKYPNRTVSLVANKKARLVTAFEYIDKIAPEFSY